MPSWMKDAWEFMERKLTDKGDLPEALKAIVVDFSKRKIAVGDMTPISQGEFVMCTFLYDIVTSIPSKKQKKQKDDESEEEE